MGFGQHREAKIKEEFDYAWKKSWKNQTSTAQIFIQFVIKRR